MPTRAKKDNLKEMENVPLDKTFVPFLNERTHLGRIRGQVITFRMIGIF